MNAKTIDALEKVCSGIQQLLSLLTAEQQLRADYLKSDLSAACSELHDALQEEDYTKWVSQTPPPCADDVISTLQQQLAQEKEAREKAEKTANHTALNYEVLGISKQQAN